jgi:hypothetical protein
VLPDLQTLTTRLTHILRTHGFAAAQLSILNRRPNVYASTFPSEIVTCQFGNGTELQVLCKYGASHGISLPGIAGHKGGVPYEAVVYRHVLRTSRATTPTFYGACADVKTGHTWLILEYLDNSLRLHRAREPSVAMSLAARWIGRFHNAAEERLSRTSTRFLTRYDTEYYLAWARRTSLVAGQLHQRFPWLTTLCGRFEEAVALLIASPPTIIHGEYYPMNILFRGGVIYPVDWESAAVAAGEIDLAAVTENWPADIARQCEVEYQRVRWPEGSPADFERRLSAARLYLSFRWLGDQANWTTHSRQLHRFAQLRSAGERLGLIGSHSQR